LPRLVQHLMFMYVVLFITCLSMADPFLVCYDSQFSRYQDFLELVSGCR
jgi:hypothetical protein